MPLDNAIGSNNTNTSSAQVLFEKVSDSTETI